MAQIPALYTEGYSLLPFSDNPSDFANKITSPYTGEALNWIRMAFSLLNCGDSDGCRLIIYRAGEIIDRLIEAF